MHHDPNFRVFDSDLDEVYTDETRYAMAYEPMWQALRMDCKGQWAEMTTARIVCARLDIYIAHATNEYNRQVRVWRVWSLANSIPRNSVTSQGLHVIPYAVGDYLTAYADKIRELKHAVGMPSEWDWATTRRGLIVMYKTNAETMYQMTKGLAERGSTLRRYELRHFLLMAHEIEKRGASDGD